MSHDHMQVEEEEEVTTTVVSCLGDMPWVRRAITIWPDDRYVTTETLGDIERFSSSLVGTAMSSA